MKADMKVQISNSTREEDPSVVGMEWRKGVRAEDRLGKEDLWH